jgi:chaperonin GroES
MNLKPLHDTVVLERHEAAKTSESGLLLPDQPKPDEGTVVAIGPKVINVTVGDHVIFGKFCGESVTFDTKELIFLKEFEIVAKKS